VGTITDYSQDVPYLMGSREMCRAINMILKDTGKTIDILVLDICYMNLVEIMYELGQEPKNTVKNVLTYIERGPVSGLPYGRVVDILENSIEGNTNEILKKMIDALNFDLIAIEINHGKLKRIKRAANDLAYTYLSNKSESVMKPFELLVDVDSDKPWSLHAREFQKNLSSIIIHYRRMGQNSGNLINIIFIELKDLIKIYSKLSFAKNNYWVHLINNKEVTDKIEIPLSDSFKPTVIKPDGLRSLIEVMNPGMSKERIEKIFDKLVELRGWKWSE
jgi:hypothetical protein